MLKQQFTFDLAGVRMTLSVEADLQDRARSQVLAPDACTLAALDQRAAVLLAREVGARLPQLHQQVAELMDWAAREMGAFASMSPDLAAIRDRLDARLAHAALWDARLLQGTTPWQPD